LLDSILEERGHPFLDALAANLVDRRLALDEALHGVAADEQLVERDAALVSRVEASAAAGAAGELELRRVLHPAPLESVHAVSLLHLLELGAVGVVLLLAIGADRARETLGEDAEERVGEVEGIDPHVEEPD